MQMVALMTSDVLAVALDISLDGRDALWEVACSENSWLSECANNHGLVSRRINYKNGFDIYQPSMCDHLPDLRRSKRPKMIWLSLPSTKWCKCANVNYNTPEKKEVLESMRRRERRMRRKAKEFLLQSLDELFPSQVGNSRL